MNTLLIFIAVAALSALGWSYLRRRRDDRFEVVMSRSRLTSSLCSQAQWIDGGNHIKVALALEPRQIKYQNSDLDASVDLDQIDEVEYESDMVTGRIADGAVLRLRSHGRAIEFILDVAAAEQWSRSLPPHRMARAV